MLKFESSLSLSRSVLRKIEGRKKTKHLRKQRPPPAGVCVQNVGLNVPSTRTQHSLAKKRKDPAWKRRYNTKSLVFGFLGFLREDDLASEKVLTIIGSERHLRRHTTSAGILHYFIFFFFVFVSNNQIGIFAIKNWTLLSECWGRGDVSAIKSEGWTFGFVWQEGGSFGGEGDGAYPNATEGTFVVSVRR